MAVGWRGLRGGVWKQTAVWLSWIRDVHYGAVALSAPVLQAHVGTLVPDGGASRAPDTPIMLFPV